jgi:hypothetical protein
VARHHGEEQLFLALKVVVERALGAAQRVLGAKFNLIPLTEGKSAAIASSADCSAETNR